MPILLPTLLNFQGSTHLFGVGSFSKLKLSIMPLMIRSISTHPGTSFLYSKKIRTNPLV